LLIFIISDTTIAELIKEVTDSNSFFFFFQTEQEFMNGIDTDKVHPYIVHCIAQKEPLIKVSARIMCVEQKLRLHEHLDFLTDTVIIILGFEPVSEGEYIDLINLYQLCVTVVLVYSWHS
jgi:hypothetical protein